MQNQHWKLKKEGNETRDKSDKEGEAYIKDHVGSNLREKIVSDCPGGVPAHD